MATHTCECGDTYRDSEVAALGHTYEAVVTDPTCTLPGYTTYTCATCGDYYIKGIVDPLGHIEEVVAGKDATCTEAGLTEGKKCSACGETLVEQEEIPATGHNFVNGKCDCGTEQAISDSQSPAGGNAWSRVVQAIVNLFKWLAEAITGIFKKFI